jgi:hypothetical protein
MRLYPSSESPRKAAVPHSRLGQRRTQGALHRVDMCGNDHGYLRLARELLIAGIPQAE